MITPTPYRGVILDADSLGQDICLDAITKTLPHWNIFPNTVARSTADRLQGCEIAITNKVIIDADIMAKNPQLKLICVAATGTNNIDLNAAKKRGIVVKNAVGYSTESVAQHCIHLLLGLSNQSRRYQKDVQDNRWSESPFFCLLDHPINELSGKTLGIIGYGNTGQAVATIARALGMQILISQRPNSDTCPDDRTALSELLRQSDVVSLHCPLSENTEHLISREELKAMKPSSLLINCARGGIVDETALLQALATGEIAGAALDVLEQEPPSCEHPLLGYAKCHSNLLLTPHIAWASVAARERLVVQIAENIQYFIAKSKPS